MLHFNVGTVCVWLLLATTAMASSALRCIMYLTGQHHVVPSDPGLTADITHVVLAFMPSTTFNVDESPAAFPLFTSVDETRRRLQPGTKVMVAIGGWGDSQGFEDAARTSQSRKRWSRQVRAMVDQTGADGVDIDWEYPGGNRDDYRLVPNREREWEIEAFGLLLQDLRAAIGPAKTLSIAVPGLERDLMAFTASTLPRIVDQVDFINVMTYDMMNRRDETVSHHSGVSGSRDALDRYAKRGVPSRMLNLGLGYYVKWFMTQDCDPKQPLGCPTQLLEDPKTGADLGKAAAFSWHDETPKDLVSSFTRAQAEGRYFEDGSYGYWDSEERRWWSFDTPHVMEQKLAEIVGPRNLGGVFAWGLGEDAPRFKHLAATLEGVRAETRRRAMHNSSRDEL
ncbi:glycosyl hydrolases family 18 domain-containing protein [Hirsutella rhossiliensis]|uniref:chitinase n=1 Tax=Hirsutella rhossiliensis TaxID=111463 RepID=A0A9P8N107_9HYPO|nr:glycosyl hydrolases family 18 domain-containing protein [Hirsutella rhossiliensis]KAH0964915.1 glycosyl hydrolases family 18 domain-containing protein [Hirsutella rhossiliensis]